MAKSRQYEIVYTLVKPISAVVEATSREKAKEVFMEKMSSNPTVTLHPDMSGTIEVKVKSVHRA